ncbi:uncharacterized protein LOC132756333 [Ruditapes philippinarum]|uniref:uncharacterized protein LOC132756333 n=1 Tax=Ruditapes philippinarum TaxID=129788 RepID=UPI00295C07E0|nr:uncharacterized protein LOC132756333 [Ruditapes philippinarum]
MRVTNIKMLLLYVTFMMIIDQLNAFRVRRSSGESSGSNNSGLRGGKELNKNGNSESSGGINENSTSGSSDRSSSGSISSKDLRISDISSSSSSSSSSSRSSVINSSSNDRGVKSSSSISTSSISTSSGISISDISTNDISISSGISTNGISTTIGISTNGIGNNGISTNGISSSGSGRNWLRDFIEGAKEMHKAYTDMIEANWKDSDKYFHARGNYDAAQHGTGGRHAAKVISDLREAYGWLKGDSAADRAADQEANKHGRNGGDPNEYRPNGLPDKYKR